MNIIEVIPVAKGLKTETLSYFGPETLAVGSVVSVPLRKKMVPGIVTAVRSARDIKGDIKQADFSLKKISIIKSKSVGKTGAGTAKGAGKNSHQFFLKEFIETAQSAAVYYASSTGSVLDALVPGDILKKSASLAVPRSAVVVEKISKDNEIENKNNKEPIKTNPPPRNLHEIRVVQGDDEERYSAYRSLIRQEFAQKKSVLVLLPTVEDTVRAFGLLEKGIEDYAFLLHTSLPAKKLIETWNAVVTQEHPVVIIATGSFLCIPRFDIGTVVVEKESSRGWKGQRRPYLDIRMVTELFTRKKGILLIMGDTLLRTETLWREAEGEILQSAPFKFRSLSTARETIVDMRQYKTAEDPADRFRVLSDEVERLIRHNKDNNQFMIILATRRGISPSVICADCQTIVTCRNCSAPIVLHKAPTSLSTAENIHNKNNANAVKSTATTHIPKNFFMCHRCGARRPADENCATCGGWRLTALGIGIDLVVEKIHQKFPDIIVSHIDSDTTTTEKQARAAIERFKTHPGSILLGTEMMLLYATKKVDNAAVISLDSLFSIPDFRIQEKIIHTLLSIRALTLRELIIQTRRADEKIFDHALKGNLNDFYRSSIEERKMWNYPPFTTLIKITLEGDKENIIAEMSLIQKNLEPQTVDIFPAFTHTVKGKYILHGLMRIPAGRWLDRELSDKLRALPPQVRVNIDPDNLL
jgi:primosomal protein N' (replication factor Y)